MQWAGGTRCYLTLVWSECRNYCNGQNYIGLQVQKDWPLSHTMSLKRLDEGLACVWRVCVGGWWWWWWGCGCVVSPPTVFPKASRVPAVSFRFRSGPSHPRSHGTEEPLRSQGWFSHKRTFPSSGNTTLSELEGGLKAIYSQIPPNARIPFAQSLIHFHLNTSTDERIHYVPSLPVLFFRDLITRMFYWAKLCIPLILIHYSDAVKISM